MCTDTAPTVACHQVSSANGTVRYSLVRGTGPSASESAVLVDFGGPGESLFSAPLLAGFIGTLPAKWQGKTYVALEEPWVLREAPVGCEQESARYYKDAQRTDDFGLATSAAALGESCHLGRGNEGWNPDDYQAALAAVLAAEHIELEGFIGASFGANRRTYLRSSQPSWTVLATPAEPPGAAKSFLTSRLNAVVRPFAACRACRTGQEAVMDIARARAASLNVHSETVPDRAVAVTAADVGAAIFGLASRPQDYEEAAALALVPSQAGAQKLGTLSDLVWGRYGTASISNSYLAYLDEVCPLYTNWSRALDHLGVNPAEQFLRRYHLPCVDIERRSTAANLRLAEPETFSQPVCMVGSKADFVTGVEAAEAWQRFSPRSTYVIDIKGRHGSPDLSSCLNAIKN